MGTTDLDTLTRRHRKLCRCVGAGAVAIVLAAAVGFGLPRIIGINEGPSSFVGAFGSCASEVQNPLRWGSDRATGNRICCMPIRDLHRRRAD